MKARLPQGYGKGSGNLAGMMKQAQKMQEDMTALPEEVEGACRETVRAYIEDLPFNGEYTNMALVDELQKVEGVKIVEFRGATTSANGETAVVPINARHVPVAGYFKAGTITINRYVYE